MTHMFSLVGREMKKVTKWQGWWLGTNKRVQTMWLKQQKAKTPEMNAHKSANPIGSKVKVLWQKWTAVYWFF